MCGPPLRRPLPCKVSVTGMRPEVGSRWWRCRTPRTQHSDTIASNKHEHHLPAFAEEDRRPEKDSLNRPTSFPVSPLIRKQGALHGHMQPGAMAPAGSSAWNKGEAAAAPEGCFRALWTLQRGHGSDQTDILCGHCADCSCPAPNRHTRPPFYERRPMPTLKTSALRVA